LSAPRLIGGVGLVGLVGLVAILGPSRAHAAPAREPSLGASPLWVLAQLAPSPTLATGDDGVHAGLRWQVTPLLYAWGVHRRVSGWRSFVVEPFVRHVGSVELFASPEVYFGVHPRWLVRPGVRAYLPVLTHGESLSVSFAASYQRVAAHDGLALEVGAYALFGVVGVQLSYALGPASPVQALATLRLRYF
jgi:hypothetical protein